MTTIFVSITGPGTTDDLTNGGREAVARAGYQVGDFDIIQDLTADDEGVVGNMEVDDRLWERMEQEGGVELAWGEYEVTADMP